jgi:large subunit ribosomal protein L6
MSRIGKAPITVPSGVDISVAGSDVAVKGPKGQLSLTLPAGINAGIEDGVITVGRTDEERNTRALHGLSRALVNNMVVGVSEGFFKELTIVGVGYRATAKGKDAIELALGFSHSVSVTAPAGIEFEVPEPTRIRIVGIDKQLVGQVAANIRAYRKPEPYKGKGIRYTDEHVVRKAGKAAK